MLADWPTKALSQGNARLSLVMRASEWSGHLILQAQRRMGPQHHPLTHSLLGAARPARPSLASPPSISN